MIDNKHINYIKSTIELAHLAASHFDVPVGAIIVKDDKIIGRGENRREIDNDPAGHAEIIAIREASKYLNSWNLSGCSLYVSLEPCAMCAGAIVNSRIENLYFGAFDGNAGCCGSIYNITEDDRFNHYVNVYGGILHDECAQILKDFFKGRRMNMENKLY